MAAHPTASLPTALDPGGIERAIARAMPALLVGAVGILGMAWWMAAQPPPGPGWGNPNDPNNPNAPRQGPEWQQPWQGQPGPPPPPPRTPSPGCSTCVAIDCADCVSSIDCANCIDCGDCLSGLDCTCAVSGASGATSVSAPVAVGSGRACSTSPWKRLAGSSGLLLPLVVMVGWRRRLRRR